MRYLILNSDIIFKIMFPDTGYRIKLLYCGTTLFKILPQRGGKWCNLAECGATW